MHDMTGFDRRTLLGGIAATATVAALPAAAQKAVAGKDAKLDALLTAQFEADLRRDPTGATSLGLDTGAQAALRAKMPDWSEAGREADGGAAAADLAALHALGRAGLSDAAAVNYDCAEFTLASQRALGRFSYHSGGFGHRPGPYGVTQLGGFYTGLSNFFDLQHPVKTRADAEAYLTRLAAVPGLLDADTAIVRANAATGVIAPRFILESALIQLAAFRDGDVRAKTLVASVERRSTAIALSGYGERAATLFEGPIRAAATRQIDLLHSLLPRAGTVAGVARLPQGRDYYAACLRQHTTTELTADAIHKLGLEQVADLTARMDALLKGAGYTKGRLRERIEALGDAPGQRFANDDAGRAALLAYLNDRLDAVRAKLPAMFARMPTTPYEIRRVPAEIQNGAPGGSAQRGSLDGTRPGVFFINLRDTAEWPRYMLPTLAFHEGAPGHLFEGALSLQNGDLPLYRQVGSATAYSEGWGLYSEQLADELGMYEGDPLGKIGYLASYAFRAARLVVDTGMHAFGWDRERAIRFMVDNTSESESAATTEIDRYIVYPGQACAYKIGQVAISRLRGEVQGRPGYDIRRFHSLVLDAGRLPLAVLERRVKGAFGVPAPRSA